jgi:lipopolysaccharide heptosyltransferase II
VTSPAWSDARRVLAVRLDALGDVLMTGPALRALRGAVPGRRVTLLTSPAGAAAATLMPGVDDVIVYEAPWMKSTPPRIDASADHTMAARLGHARFDGAVIFTVYSQNPLPAALLCYLAGIPLRLAHCHENPYQLLTDWIVDGEPGEGIRHEVRRQLDLAGAIGGRLDDERMALRVPATARRRVDALLDGCGFGRGRRPVILHPGASAPSRRYPPEAFARVVRGLIEADLDVALTGRGDEAALVDDIVRASGVSAVSLAGRLDLAELAAVIERAPLLVSNNTAPVHVAAALGTPVVDLYALTNPQHTPWAVRHRVLSHDVPCKYCYKSVCPAGHHDCLRRIDPARVIAAAFELLAEHRRAA